jgi:pimeloyl-ACP methyl ester carboxylesterase
MSEAISQVTAPNRAVDAADGVRYAYRRYGNTASPALPLVLLQHFRGNLDNWDPLVVDVLAEEREIVLFDNAGVGGSTGAVPSDIQDMAQGVVSFTNAVGLARYDVLGFSLGGFVAQALTMIRPYQIRRLVLAGTGPEGGRNMPGATVWSGDILRSLILDEQGADDLLTLFFERTESSINAGKEFIGRLFTREEDRDRPVDLAARDAQITAIMRWGVRDDTRLARLAAIAQPTLVANGDNDLVVPTENSHRLGRHLPNARVSIYPDAGHGFLNQYPGEFAAEVNAFLGR